MLKESDVTQKMFEDSFNQALILLKHNALRVLPEWLKPIPSKRLKKSYDDDDYGSELLEKAVNNAIIEMNMNSRMKSRRLNEDEYFEDFNNMVDSITTKQKIHRGVTKAMNKSEILETALELMKSGDLTETEVSKIEGRLNRGAPLEARWIGLIKGKAKAEDDDYDENEDELEESIDEDEYDEDEILRKKKKKKRSPPANDEEAEYGEEQERTGKSVDYDTETREIILGEVIELCKSDKITLEEAIQVENCVNKGIMLPERIERVLGVEYVDEDDLLKADTVSDSSSGHRRRKPSKVYDTARGGEDFEDDDFNTYFGMSTEEALDRLTDLHFAGKISTMAVIKLESRIRKGAEIPKEFEKYFKKGKWLE